MADPKNDIKTNSFSQIYTEKKKNKENIIQYC